MKSPREVLEQFYYKSIKLERTGYFVPFFIQRDKALQDLDQALSELAEIVMGLKKDEDKGNGKECDCHSWGGCECGCGADWNDYSLYNRALTDIAKLFSDKEQNNGNV